MRRTIPIWALIAILSAVLLGTLDPLRAAAAGSSAKDRGAELFSAKGCTYCHGPAGVGGGIGPDLQLVRQRRTRDQIVMQIENGGKTMPNFGDKLSAGQIDDLVAFLRAKRKYKAVPAKANPVPVTTMPSTESN